MPNENETPKPPDGFVGWLDFAIRHDSAAQTELAALRRELSDSNYWRERHCRESEAHGLKTVEQFTELAALRERVAELEAWKSEQQKALITCGVMLLDAGYKGDGLVDGLRWALDDAKQTREIAKDIESCNSEIENQLRERVKQLESEAKQARDAALDEAADAVREIVSSKKPVNHALEIARAVILSLKGGNGTTG